MTTESIVKVWGFSRKNSTINSQQIDRAFFNRQVVDSFFTQIPLSTPQLDRFCTYYIVGDKKTSTALENVDN